MAVVAWVAPRGSAAQAASAADTADAVAVAMRAVEKRGPVAAKARD